MLYTETPTLAVPSCTKYCMAAYSHNSPPPKLKQELSLIMVSIPL